MVNSVDPAKIEVVLKWERPKNVTEIRSFLSLAGCYWLFGESFFLLSPHSHQLERMPNFIWTDACGKRAFQELTQWLKSAPIRTIPDNVGGLIVYTDASHTGLGCVMIQKQKGGCIQIKTIENHEKNYPVHDLELAATIFALQKKKIGGIIFRVRNLKCILTIRV